MLAYGYQNSSGELLMQHSITQLNIRIPQEMKQFLSEEAKKDERSLNSYVLQVFKKLKEQSREVNS